jgi:hypothetical protein
MSRPRWITPDTTGDSNIARCLIVPEKLQPAVNWALEQLTFPENWEQVGDLTPQECADAFVEVLSAYYESEDCSIVLTDRQEFQLWRAGNPTVGNPLVASVLSTQELNTIWAQSASAINDEVEFMLLLEQGFYDLYIMGRKLNSGGIQHWLVDGAEDGETIDMYAASALVNYTTSINLSFTYSGLHSLKCKMSTKNASSSGYTNQMTWIKLIRTGD